MRIDHWADNRFFLILQTDKYHLDECMNKKTVEKENITLVDKIYTYNIYLYRSN